VSNARFHSLVCFVCFGFFLGSRIWARLAR
jgi:hypothetical protein